MGKPATTYWCGNGHLLEDNAHHEWGERDVRCQEEMCLAPGDPIPERDPYKWKCEICGSTEEFMTTEWSDPDYWQDGEPEVPLAPVRYDEVKRVDHRGNEYFEEVGVYDIGELKARRRK